MPKGKEKTAKIAARGKARAEKRAARKTQRTERLAGRKNITTDQAKQLQENRRTRFREFAAGGTENITTGRLRFSSDPSGESTPDSSAGPSDVKKNAAPKVTNTPDFSVNYGSITQDTTDRLGNFQDRAIGRGGNAYSAGTVEVGDVTLEGNQFSEDTLKKSGYKPRGAGGYAS